MTSVCKTRAYRDPAKIITQRMSMPDKIQKKAEVYRGYVMWICTMQN